MGKQRVVVLCVCVWVRVCVIWSTKLRRAGVKCVGARNNFFSKKVSLVRVSANYSNIATRSEKMRIETFLAVVEKLKNSKRWEKGKKIVLATYKKDPLTLKRDKNCGNKYRKTLLRRYGVTSKGTQLFPGIFLGL